MGRALLLLLAAVALAVAVVRAGDDRACSRAQRDAFAIGLRGGAPSPQQRVSDRALDPDAVARRARAGCTGGAALAAASTGLLRGRATNAAAELARSATQRDPDDYRGWSAFAAVLTARGNAGGATAARARVVALRPPRPTPG